MSDKEKIGELKNETMNSLNGYINAETEEIAEDVDKTCNNIINKFMEIANELSIPINEEYIISQMSITKHEIVEELQNSNEYLSEEIYLRLNRLIDTLIEENGELRMVSGALEGLIDSKKQEKKQEYIRIEDLMDERIKDLVSNASRRLYNLQMSRSEETLEQLECYVNRVKSNEINRIVENLDMKDTLLFENIEKKIENFCREVERIEEQKKEEETEKKSWELSEKEAEKINPQEAIEAAEKKAQKRENERTLDLPSNILE